MTSRTILAIVGLFAAASFAAPAGAAVVTDPALGTEIDPAGFETVNTHYGAAPDTLEQDASFGVVQDFDGFVGYDATSNPAPVVNILSFTDPNRPDVRFTLTGSTDDGAGGALLSDVYQTSTGAGFKLNARSKEGDLTLSIEFGSYDGGSSLFTPGASVASVGFALAAHRSGIAYTATFYNADGQAVGTVGPTAGANEGDSYTDVSIAYRWDGTLSNAVSKVVLFRDGTSRGTTSQGFDDFGFALVPEPGSAALVALGLVGLLARRRRA